MIKHLLFLLLYISSAYSIDCIEMLQSSKDFDIRERVHYLPKDELKTTIVHILNGRLINNKKKPVTTRQGLFGSIVNYIFVLDTDYNLYLTKFYRNYIHHSSLAGGEPVLMAGSMKVIKGRIVIVSNMSGHYKPSKERLEWFMLYLEKQGIDISKIKVNIE